MINSLKNILAWCFHRSVRRDWRKKLRKQRLLKKGYPYLPDSCSQINQDLFVLGQTGCKEGGYFVEFGATDGVSLSNTFLLESKFNWKGILAEPGRNWHHLLKKNRKHSIIDTRCVFDGSLDSVIFREAELGELSTIDTYSDCDMHSANRANGLTYNVEAVTLLDLLIFHNAPYDIDYLSIDTEGSEYDILKAFDFSQYNIKIITCEHNYTSNREKIYRLLIENGYRRVGEEFSKWDDWYVKDT